MGVLAEGTRVVLFVLICSLIPGADLGPGDRNRHSAGNCDGPCRRCGGGRDGHSDRYVHEHNANCILRMTLGGTFSRTSRPGLYDVSVSKAGFRVTKVPEAGSHGRRDAHLEHQARNRFERGNRRSLCHGRHAGNDERHGGPDDHRDSGVGLPARFGARREHFRDAAAWRGPRRQRGRSEPGSEFVHVGWRQ